MVFRTEDGGIHQQVLLRGQTGRLRIVPPGQAAHFTGDPADFKLGMEALRIQMAAQFDPMLAVATSDLDPLPHQIQAVYGDLLGKDQPLRYLLADDPGAGKTIMAGLFIKELTLRGDLQRCLIVVPGGLVDQWQDELHDKLGLRFDILTADLVAATPPSENPFAEYPRLIVRMDQVARNDPLLAHLARTEWDVVVVDEAHKMAAHYFGGELKTTKRYQLGQLLGGITRHLLLMTATPHSGKEEDFQAFLALLDPDRFEGRYRKHVHGLDTSGMMCRRVKEELLTFDGRPLFPERRATTLPYELSPAEMDLYEAVTHYVRAEMGRADQLKAAGEGRRGNTVAYPVEELGGMLFAYMGPKPVPQLPRLDGFVATGTVRMIGQTLVPCNWLQIMENSLDPVHTEWLHGHLQEWIEEQRDGVKPKYALSRHHVKIAFEEFEYGIYKRRLMEGQSEDVDDWRVGHPVMFPCTLSVGSAGGFWTMYALQIRVPVDDTHTLHYWYTAFMPPAGAHAPAKLLDEVPLFDVPVRNESGEFVLDMVDSQDVMAWASQGPIAKRELEKLGTTDRGVILLRRSSTANSRRSSAVRIRSA